MAMAIPFGGGRMEFTWHNCIGEIPAASWDSCLVSDTKSAGGGTCDTSSSPFLEHGWIHSLEESGCASEETGWIPCHVTVKIVDDNNRSCHNNETAIDGCVPVYLKTHSTGEFIFDNAWADAAYRNQIDYYPKLLVGVPFTPVSGSRLLWHSRVRELYPLVQLDRAVGTFLKQSAMARNLSSVHVNFCTDQEAAILSSYYYDDAGLGDCPPENENVGADENKDQCRQRLRLILLRHLQRNDTDVYLRRTTLQYHWHNRNPLRNGRPFTDFEDYLTCFKSKRRITIRRERVKAKRGYNDDAILTDDKHNRPVRIDAVVGADVLQVEGLVERMFEIYRSTVDKLYWGRQYLTLDFFQRLCQTSFVRNLCFLCARYDDDDDDNDPVSMTNGSVWKGEDVFAGTFNVIQSGVFYGRYWGCLPGHDVARKNLHFETCYWSAIDYCIQNGLERMEPGAGGGGK
jgi:uncharacterized protein